MNAADRPLLAYYGDDLTGSTDVLEALSNAGVRSALFLEPPGPDVLRGRFAGLQAVGVAGTSRAMSPEQMEAVLPPAFEALGTLGAGIVHYKVCSTFDSSPEVGSIGRAIDIGRRIHGPEPVPMVVGAPVLKRYCVFGNLFATVGPETYRIDRHPTMSRHPVTPMDEGDLRRHLARQTGATIALMDILHLDGPDPEVDRRYAAILDGGPGVILFDTLDEASVRAAGRLVWNHRGVDRPRFAVGSSGLEYALVAHWREIGILAEAPPIVPPGPAGRLAVVSGSCSPTTRDQIAWAFENGFLGVEVDAGALSDPDPDRSEAERSRATGCAADALRTSDAGVIIHAALGPDDPRIAAALGRGRDRGQDPGATRERLGERLGLILRDLIESAGLRRAVVAGGDTSGHAARGLEIDALEFILTIAPGSPLCRASSRRPAIDGLEVVLKGGQVGRRDFFGGVLRGGL